MKWRQLILSLIVSASTATGEEETVCPCKILKRPDLHNTLELARWMVHTLSWGVLSTVSSRLPDGIPFGNIYSFVDGSCNNSTGSIYFYGSPLDQSFKDMTSNPKASFALSEASLPSVCAGEPLRACSISHSNLGDPESPVCARLTISGSLAQVEMEADEYAVAQAAFFQRHPQMQYWPKDHNWQIVKLEITDLWLINYFGGAKILPVKDYFATSLGVPEESS